MSNSIVERTSQWRQAGITVCRAISGRCIDALDGLRRDRCGGLTPLGSSAQIVLVPLWLLNFTVVKRLLPRQSVPSRYRADRVTADLPAASRPVETAR